MCPIAMHIIHCQGRVTKFTMVLNYRTRDDYGGILGNPSARCKMAQLRASILCLTAIKSATMHALLRALVRQWAHSGLPFQWLSAELSLEPISSNNTSYHSTHVSETPIDMCYYFYLLLHVQIDFCYLLSKLTTRGNIHITISILALNLNQNIATYECCHHFI